MVTQALTPEKANTFTIGAVITPEDFMPGLTVSVDYWSIEILEAIDTVEPEFIVNQCGLTGDPAFCALVNRGNNGNLWIGSSATAPNIVSTNINIGFFETSGVDFFGNYDMEVGNYGVLDFTFRGTWLEKFDQQLTPGAAIENVPANMPVPAAVRGRSGGTTSVRSGPRPGISQ